jgi:hypothetical protein
MIENERQNYGTFSAQFRFICYKSDFLGLYAFENPVLG